MRDFGKMKLDLRQHNLCKIRVSISVSRPALLFSSEIIHFQKSKHPSSIPK